MRFIYLALIILVLASVAIVLAEDDRSNEPNWCYEGQAWGDGRCNHADPYINDYNWRMGWLMAHCEMGYFPAELCFVPDDSVIVGGDGDSWDGYAFFTLGGGGDSGGPLDINGNPIIFSPPSFFIGDTISGSN